MYRPSILLILVLACSWHMTTAQVQFGLDYTYLQTENWTYSGAQPQNMAETVFESGYAIRLGYEFQIVPQPITTLGGSLRLNSYEYGQTHPASNLPMEFDLNSYTYQLSATSYLLDKWNNRQMPCSLKKGPWFQKGFHVYMQAGVANFRSSVSHPPRQSDQTNRDTRFLAGVGIGQDFPLSNHLSLEVHVGSNYIPTLEKVQFIIPSQEDTITLFREGLFSMGSFLLHTGVSIIWHIDAIDCIMLPVEPLQNVNH